MRVRKFINVPVFYSIWSLYLMILRRANLLPGFRIRIRIRMDRINLSCWIRIRIQIADPDPGGQK